MQQISEHKMPILEAVDRSFDLGTRENHVLNGWLIVPNMILVLFLVFDLLEYLNYITFWSQFHIAERNIEIVFGMLFLIEFSLRSVFVYIPDKKMISLYSVINILVVVSLLAPHFIGNLAILRFIRILKGYKVYQLNKDYLSYHVDSKDAKASK